MHMLQLVLIATYVSLFWTANDISMASILLIMVFNKSTQEHSFLQKLVGLYCELEFNGKMSL